MFNKPLQQVIGVAPNAMATLHIPSEQSTLVGIKLNLGATTANWSSANISRIVVKIGPRTIWDLQGSQLLSILGYKNQNTNSEYLWLDFCERDQAPFPLKEVGGIDLTAVLPVGEVYVNIYINSTAVAPVITAQGYFEQSQGNAAVLKYMPFSFATPAAGKFTLPLNLRGALLKRLWLFYSGTVWTATTNGCLSRLECKKNGIVFFDQMDLDARFDQINFKKVPQTGLFVADFIVDNNHNANIATMRQSTNGQLVYDAFEFNAYPTDATGTAVSVVAEVLDSVTNL